MVVQLCNGYFNKCEETLCLALERPQQSQHGKVQEEGLGHRKEEKEKGETEVVGKTVKCKALLVGVIPCDLWPGAKQDQSVLTPWLFQTLMSHCAAATGPASPALPGGWLKVSSSGSTPDLLNEMCLLKALIYSPGRESQRDHSSSPHSTSTCPGLCHAWGV